MQLVLKCFPSLNGRESMQNLNSKLLILSGSAVIALVTACSQSSSQSEVKDSPKGLGPLPELYAPCHMQGDASREEIYFDKDCTTGYVLPRFEVSVARITVGDQYAEICTEVDQAIEQETQLSQQRLELVQKLTTIALDQLEVSQALDLDRTRTDLLAKQKELQLNSDAAMAEYTALDQVIDEQRAQRLLILAQPVGTVAFRYTLSSKAMIEELKTQAAHQGVTWLPLSFRETPVFSTNMDLGSQYPGGPVRTSTLEGATILSEGVAVFQENLQKNVEFTAAGLCQQIVRKGSNVELKNAQSFLLQFGMSQLQVAFDVTDLGNPTIKQQLILTNHQP
jgi:hypothetical protein